jgi:hypothetical protein
MKFVQAQSEFGELMSFVTVENLAVGLLAFWVMKLFAT